jgi:hypothetical protein
METFKGQVNKEELKTVVQKALKVKPNAKRLFGRINDTKLEFIVRMDPDKTPCVVHSISVKPEQIIPESSDENLNKAGPEGYPICISIPRYLANTNNMKEPRTLYWNYDSGLGTSVSCPL